MNYFYLILFTLVIAKSLSITCNYDSCPYTRGMCQFGDCVCRRGYSSTFDSLNEKEGFCQYKKYKTKIFLAFESVFLGIGHMYVGRFFFGLFKLAFTWVFSIFALQFSISLNKLPSDLEQTRKLKLYISALLITFPIIIHAIDLYLIGKGYYLDGNGVDIVAL